MTFKDDLAVDLDTFLELEEYAEEVEMDGVRMKVVIVETSAQKSNRLTEQYSGLEGDFSTIYFKEAEYTAQRERLPHFGEWVRLKGKRYDVVKVTSEYGMVRMECSGYRQPVLRGG